MTKVIAITNNKGGVGKTTCAANLAGAYAESGLRVLVIDLDPQANLSDLFITPGTRPSLFDVFVHEVPLAEAIHKTSVPGVFIVPASQTLLNLDAHLQHSPDAQVRLALELNEVQAGKQSFDVVILDCPPSLGLTTRNALAAANRVVIPIEAAKFSVDGLHVLLATIESMRRAVNKDLEIAGALMSRFNSRRTSQRGYEEELRKRKLRIFDVKIKDSAVYAAAIEERKLITDYKSRSEFANAFRDLVSELENAYAHN